MSERKKIMKNISMKNANRFMGFADTYDNARPSMPLYPVNIIKRYLGHEPNTVVDLGCGTGLSTVIWQGNCKNIIGVEPSNDMRSVAIAKSTDEHPITFIKGYSHDTGIDTGIIDVVICSQSFHWMEPVAALNEINRILIDTGVFATVDCDWPPVSNWKIERAYEKLFKKVHDVEKNTPVLQDNFIRYSKDQHLSNMIDSGLFSYARELLFSNTESCTADRLFKLVMSQGGLQGILKHDESLIIDDINAFKSAIDETYSNNTFDIEFSYRMRIAVK